MQNICTTVFGLAIVLFLANLAGATVVNVQLADNQGGPTSGIYTGQAPTRTPATTIGITCSLQAASRTRFFDAGGFHRGCHLGQLLR